MNAVVMMAPTMIDGVMLCRLNRPYIPGMLDFLQ